MIETSATAQHILQVFLIQVSQHGLTATTTKALAMAAGVNEVTIFRLFTDKAGVVTAAFQFFDLPGKIAACPVIFDGANAQAARATIVEVIRYLRDVLLEHRALVLVGVSEYHKYPQLRDEAAKAPAAAQHLITATLEHAQPYLQPSIHIPTTVISLMGFLFLTMLWDQNGWVHQYEAASDEHIASLIAPLFLQ